MKKSTQPTLFTAMPGNFVISIHVLNSFKRGILSNKGIVGNSSTDAVSQEDFTLPLQCQWQQSPQITRLGVQDGLVTGNQINSEVQLVHEKL